MNRLFFNNRVVPTLVLLALSCVVFIAADCGALNQAFGQDKKINGELTASDIKGCRRAVADPDDIYLSSAKQHQKEAESAKRSDLWYFRELLKGSSFEVNTKTSLAKRDPQTKRLVPGNKTFTFVKDELACFETISDRDGYLYVFGFGADNRITILFPANIVDKDGNVIEGLEKTDNSVKANQKIAIPKPGVRIRTSAPFGAEALLTIVTTEKIKPKKLRELVDSGEFEGAITGKALAELSKNLVTEEDIDEFVVDEPETTFEYGVHRQFYYAFETEKERQAFLANQRTIFIGIGINDYWDTSIRNLPSCVNDVKTLAEILKAQGAVDEVFLITNEEATVDNVKYLFTAFLPEYLTPNDRVIVHWSSHGYMTKAKEMHFVAHDSEKLKIETMISSDSLNIWANNLNTKLLFIFDACYSGGAVDPKYNWAKTFRKNNEYTKAIGGDLLSIVTSSSEVEVSLVNRDGKKFSLMSSVMIDYLKKRRGVDAIELGSAIAPLVDKLAMEQFNKHQTVYGYEGVNGEFVINPEK